MSLYLSQFMCAMTQKSWPRSGPKLTLLKDFSILRLRRLFYEWRYSSASNAGDRLPRKKWGSRPEILCPLFPDSPFTERRPLFLAADANPSPLSLLGPLMRSDFQKSWLLPSSPVPGDMQGLEGAALTEMVESLIDPLLKGSILEGNRAA